MRYFICIFCLILLNCVEEKDHLKDSDIIRIVHRSNNILNDITGNTYILDERFKKPGIHSLMLKSSDIDLIKKKIIQEKIYKLDDSLKFIKSCNKICLSEIIIQYKSGRKQHFMFDNYHYRDNFNNKLYKKITNLEKEISEIIMTKRIDAEPVNFYF